MFLQILMLIICLNIIWVKLRATQLKGLYVDRMKSCTKKKIIIIIDGDQVSRRLILTVIRSGIRQAWCPLRVSIGVRGKISDLDEYLRIHCPDLAIQYCSIDNSLFSLHDGEDYVCIVTPASVFQPDWDKHLVHDMENILGQKHERHSVITANPRFPNCTLHIDRINHNRTWPRIGHKLNEIQQAYAIPSLFVCSEFIFVNSTTMTSLQPYRFTKDSFLLGSMMFAQNCRFFTPSQVPTQDFTKTAPQTEAHPDIHDVTSDLKDYFIYTGIQISKEQVVVTQRALMGIVNDDCFDEIYSKFGTLINYANAKRTITNINVKPLVHLIKR